MEPDNKFMLLFISLYLVVSCSSARPQFSPTISPSLQPEESSPVPLAETASVPSSSAESVSVLSPSPGPASVPSSSPESASTPSVSPSPATDSTNHVSFHPSISDPPSDSMSPDADVPSESNSASSIDMISTMLSSLKPSESDGPSPLDDISKFLSSVKVDPEVEKICESTDHPALCVATVAPLLKSENIDVKSVLEVAIKASSTFTQFVLSVAKKLAKKPGTPPEMKSILNDCKDSYDTALSNFEETITAFSQNDIGTMNSMLSAVMTFVGDCEDSFDGLGIESPLMDYSDKLTNMTSNCLAIVSLMN